MLAASHFILYVEDQKRSTDFYCAVLLIEPRLLVPGMTEYALPGGGILGLMPESAIRELLGPALSDPCGAHGTPRSELYLVLAEAESYHSRSLAAGAKELSPMQLRSWGHLAGYSLDPDGHVLAFAAPWQQADSAA